MRILLMFLLYVPLGLGFVVGLVVSPFVIGYSIAHEFLADQVEKSYRRLRSRNQPQ